MLFVDSAALAGALTGQGWGREAVADKEAAQLLMLNDNAAAVATAATAPETVLKIAKF